MQTGFPTFQPAQSTFAASKSLSGTSLGRTSHAKSPRFGTIIPDVGTIAQAITQVAPQQQPTEEKRNASMRRRILQGLALPLLTLALANIPAGVTAIRQMDNQHDGQPLTSVLPGDQKNHPLDCATIKPPPPSPKTPAAAASGTTATPGAATPAAPAADPVTANQPPNPEVVKSLICTLEDAKSWPDPSKTTSSKIVLEAARAGLVKEVVLNAADAKTATAVLINGKEVSFAYTDDVADQLQRGVQRVPITPPLLNGVSMNYWEAAAVALLLVGVFSSLLSAPKKVKQKAHVDVNILNKKAEMARRIAADKLGVSREPLTPEVVERQLKGIYDFGERPLTMDEVRKRMVVALAPVAVERKLDGDRSLFAMADRKMLRQIIEDVSKELGVDELVPGFVAGMKDEELAPLVEAAINDALRQADEIFAPYSKENLANLQGAFHKRGNALKATEIEQLLTGTPWSEVHPPAWRRASNFVSEHWPGQD